AAHNNDRWMELETYVRYMEEAVGREMAGAAVGQKNTGRHHEKWLSLDYFRYNITCLPEGNRFAVSYTNDWETDFYTKHYDGSVSYQKELRDVQVEDVIALTEQTMEEHVVYRMADYKEIDAASMKMLTDLIDYLQRQNVEVILYLPPYSPMLYDYIESEEDFQIAFEVEARMKQLASEKGLALYGSYDPEGSGLAMTDLYDLYHVKTEKTPDTYFPVVLP
ncbi:MAG: hypothetical protein K2H40_12905, partial [Lachnospiraceae bacterium]|nr:hypothetical protein [Lachnospiraceae bacterium]